MTFRKLLSVLIIILTISMASYAQSASVKGTVTDTVEKKNLPNVVIAILRKTDSVLVKFVRSDKDGKFSLLHLPQGKMIVQLSHPAFADYVDTITLNPGSEIDLAGIFLTPKSKILEEVFLKQNVAIRLKGDTIEYKADSFKVQDGASVKDLLKKLPGLQVDKNGQITAQGQKVEKVLVDGEEFFSDDPAVVIENLRADAIDKVQSFDKKSAQAEFTGVDDGNKTKTLNLVLKDDKKKGYLGKIVIGGGTDERYSGQAMLNFFKGKKKISVYGITSNTATTGLGWEDRGKFGGGSDFSEGDMEIGAGFIMFNNNGDNDFNDWQNTYYDEGIPETIKAGLHFSNKWNNDKQNINGNYSLRNMKTLALGNSLTKFILPDSAYYSKEDHKSNTKQTQQLLSGVYDFKFDSLSSLRIKVNGKLVNDKNTTLVNAETDDENLQVINKNFRSNSGTGDTKIFLTSALWRQKLKKKGRTISLLASQKYSDKNSTGYLFSATEYFFNGSPNGKDTVDQYKSLFTKTLTTTSRLVYTEPLGKKALLEFNYAFNQVNSKSDRKSFDKFNNKYELLNNLFSIKYGLNYLTNSAGFKYQYTGKKIIANIGTNIGFSDLTQRDSVGRRIKTYHFFNLFPTARFNYKIAAQRNLSVSYSGTPGPPGIEQVQPILENTNPLFVTIGNANLRQSFSHNISLFYNDFKMLTGRNIWINGDFNTVQDAIVTSQVIDAQGKTTQQYINTKGNYNYSLYLNYGMKIKKIDIYTDFSISTSGSRYVNFVNSLKTISNNQSTGFEIRLWKSKEDKYEISATANFKKNSSTTNISNIKSNFLSQDHGAQASINLTKKIILGSDMNFYHRQKIDAFDKNNNLTVWNTYLSYKLFKKNNGVLKFEVNDILKQRRGYDRSYTSNKLYERNYNMLGQFALLSFTWNFTKTPGATTK